MKRLLVFVGMFGLMANWNVYATGNWVNAQNWLLGVTGTAELTSCEIDEATFNNGVANVLIPFVDLAAKSQTALRSVEISTTTLAAGQTTFITNDLTQPAIPRNIVVFSSMSSTAQAISSATITGTVYVAGINSVGISTNEYISLVSTADAAAGRGKIAWNSISSITISGFTFLGTNGVDGLLTNHICVGTSDDIGLMNNLESGDILKVVDNGSNSTTYTANYVYETIRFASTPNGSIDFYVEENVKKTPRR